MLVLSRKPGQRIFLTLPDGRLIGIEVQREVSLAFDAPPDVDIYREELLRKEAGKP